MSDASGKWVVKGEVPPELLYGVPCVPQGGIEITTPTRPSCPKENWRG